MMMLHYGYYFYLLLIIMVQVLLLQPDRALPPHLQHGRARLHPAAGLGREAIARWVKSDIEAVFDIVKN